MDLREQLEELRAAIDRASARADARVERESGYFERAVGPRIVPLPPGKIEELLPGEIVTTARGQHFETVKLYAPHQRHGSYEIADLESMPADLLMALSDGAIPHTHPRKWAFLDTETTGLAGGSGTCAFLIGLGSIEDDGFLVRQFFMRDHSEEASALDSLARYLARFDVLVTYNGRSYDQPLLETRYTMCRARHPFSRMEHLDLLYGARRLFKLRLENCRLVNLENQILGVERHGDIPGEMIPYCYFEYLRTRRGHRLVGVFEHNILDIVSLACLTGVIPEAFRDPENAHARHGIDLLGLARWLQVSGRLEEAHRLLRRAVDMGLPDSQLFRALFEAGGIEKKLGWLDAAVATFVDLTISRNAYQVRAYEELAKHYEHKEKNAAMALECVRAARCLEDSEALAAREARLQRKASGVRLQRGLALNRSSLLERQT
jgi:uncharacterized protein YprB with RNaseH-like and TPR domain